MLHWSGLFSESTFVWAFDTRMDEEIDFDGRPRRQHGYWSADDLGVPDDVIAKIALVKFRRKILKNMEKVIGDVASYVELPIVAPPTRKKEGQEDLNQAKSMAMSSPACVVHINLQTPETSSCHGGTSSSEDLLEGKRKHEIIARFPKQSVTKTRNILRTLSQPYCDHFAGRNGKGFSNSHSTSIHSMKREDSRHLRGPLSRSTSNCSSSTMHETSIPEFNFIETLDGTLDKKLNDDDDTFCVICLNEYEDGDLLRKLPCSHQFHIKFNGSYVTNFTISSNVTPTYGTDSFQSYIYVPDLAMVAAIDLVNNSTDILKDVHVNIKRFSDCGPWWPDVESYVGASGGFASSIMVEDIVNNHQDVIAMIGGEYSTTTKFVFG
ncbi:UNVERIFIED_CONTAM: hypothetical protein HDU68_003056 [Siphonaria sp. JEL0065]|nr:hypothetical protein HDU68_003056 [Siphonaria sp. JEL0065]